MTFKGCKSTERDKYKYLYTIIPTTVILNIEDQVEN